MSRVLIIAEAGVNHNGDINIAKQLCLAAKKAGADVVKFQTWITERIITRNVAQAEYQIENTNNRQTQFSMLKSLELSFEQFKQIKAYCDEIGIQFASTADESESLDFLVDLGIPFIKLGSGEIGNIPYLRYVGSKKIPVIMSTGMSTLGNVEKSIQALRDGGATNITLLHCTTNYPCPYDSVNLKAMETLRVAFGCKVGYSDHTIGISIPTAAVAMGATVIEKHFTLDRNMVGPDHIASTEPAKFREMVDAIRNVECALGTGMKTPDRTEIDISKVILKKIVASKKIVKGQIIKEEDISIKRSSDGLPGELWDYVIGTKAIKDYNIDEGIII